MRGTRLYKLYRYVPPQPGDEVEVWFSRELQSV